MSNIQELLKAFRQEYDFQMPAIQQLQEAIAQRREKLDELELEIKAAVLEQARSEKGYGITATYRSGYVKNSWDNAKLEGFAAAFPQILEFRKQSNVGPSVAMKVIE